jgi:hypothetical protein
MNNLPGCGMAVDGLGLESILRYAGHRAGRADCFPVAVRPASFQTKQGTSPGAPEVTFGLSETSATNNKQDQNAEY